MLNYAPIRASDTVWMRGEFVLRVLNKKGEVIERYSDHNMIVNNARQHMAELVAEGGQIHAITRFGVGTGTIEPTPADTALTDVYSNAILRFDYPEAYTARFFWRLDYGEANNKNIAEFGLICADGSLFSRKVRSPLYKSSDLLLEGEWSIIF